MAKKSKEEVIGETGRAIRNEIKKLYKLECGVRVSEKLARLVISKEIPSISEAARRYAASKNHLA